MLFTTIWSFIFMCSLVGVPLFLQRELTSNYTYKLDFDGWSILLVITFAINLGITLIFLTVCNATGRI